VKNIVVVFLGGGAGAALRYWLSGFVYRLFGTGFPYGTMAVNATGCLLIGILLAISEERFSWGPGVRVFLSIGLLGGFTTFSTFSYETIAMVREGSFLAAGVNALGSLVLCLCATWAGWQLGRMV
jgi:CrcB protein